MEYIVWFDSGIQAKFDTTGMCTDVLFRKKGLFSKWKSLQKLPPYEDLLFAKELLMYAVGKKGRNPLISTFRLVPVDEELREAAGLLDKYIKVYELKM